MNPAGLLLAEGFDPQQLLLFAGIALFVLTMVRISVRRARRARNEALQNRTLRKPDRPSAATVLGDQHAVELNELFRELGARLDTKMHVLNELLIEAEARIAELRRLTSEAPPHLSRKTTDGQLASGAAVGDDSLVVEPEAPAHAIDTNETPAACAARVSGPERNARTQHAEIHTLADQGLSSRQIAEQLGQPIGEVELIIGLHRRRQQAARSKGMGG